MSQIPSLSSVGMSGEIRVPDARLSDPGPNDTASGFAKAGQHIFGALEQIATQAVAKEAESEYYGAIAKYAENYTGILAEAESGKYPSLVDQAAFVRTRLDASKKEILSGVKHKSTARKFGDYATMSAEEKSVAYITAQGKKIAVDAKANASLAITRMHQSGDLKGAIEMGNSAVASGTLMSAEFEALHYTLERGRQSDEILTLGDYDPETLRKSTFTHAADIQKKVLANYDLKRWTSQKNATIRESIDGAHFKAISAIPKAGGAAAVRLLETEIARLADNTSMTPEVFHSLTTYALGKVADLAAADQAVRGVFSNDALGYEQHMSQPYARHVSPEFQKFLLAHYSGGPQEATPTQLLREEAIRTSFGTTEPLVRTVADILREASAAGGNTLTRKQAISLMGSMGQSDSAAEKKADMAASHRAMLSGVEAGSHFPVGIDDPSASANANADMAEVLESERSAQTGLPRGSRDLLAAAGGDLWNSTKTDAPAYHARVLKSKTFQAAERSLLKLGWVAPDFAKYLTGALMSGSPESALDAAKVISAFTDNSPRQSAAFVEQVGMKNIKLARLLIADNGKNVNAVRDSAAKIEWMNKEGVTIGDGKNAKSVAAHAREISAETIPLYKGNLQANADFVMQFEAYVANLGASTPGVVESATNYAKSYVEQNYKVVEGTVHKQSPWQNRRQGDWSYGKDLLVMYNLAWSQGVTDLDDTDIAKLLWDNGVSREAMKSSFVNDGYVPKKVAAGSLGAFTDEALFSYDDVSRNDLLFAAVMNGVSAKNPAGGQVFRKEDLSHPIAVKWLEARFQEWDKKGQSAILPRTQDQIYNGHSGEITKHMSYRRVGNNPEAYHILLGNQAILGPDGFPAVVVIRDGQDRMQRHPQRPEANDSLDPSFMERWLGGGIKYLGEREEGHRKARAQMFEENDRAVKLQRELERERFKKSPEGREKAAKDEQDAERNKDEESRGIIRKE